jgi:hypothetical protein
VIGREERVFFALPRELRRADPPGRAGPAKR